ncbi:MAG: LptF/LptG family permease [Planctomycetota bacterium]
MKIKLIDRNLLKKFLLILFLIHLLFVALYIIGYTIDNLGRFYELSKKKGLILQLYKYNVLMALFYIFPFAAFVSLVVFYLYFYLEKENISIVAIGYKCNSFKKYAFLTLLLSALSMFFYYDFVFTRMNVEDRKLSIMVKQSYKYYNPVLTIDYKNNNSYYIVGKVFNFKNNTIDNVYFYIVKKNVEIFSTKGIFSKNNLIFKEVKLFKNSRAINKKKIIFYIPNISKEIPKIFVTIDGLKMGTVIGLYRITKNKVFLFELFKRITYILNGIFIAINLLIVFNNIIMFVELVKYLTFFVFFSIVFISLYFFIFLLAKNLYNIYIGIILWLWSLLIFYLLNRRLVLYGQ